MTTTSRSTPRRKPFTPALLALMATTAVAQSYWSHVTVLSGTLDDGYYRTHAVNLRAGYTYRFVGACDRDCSDLDLVLRDSSRARVDEDREDDDQPVLVVDVYRSGTYSLEAHMADCWDEPCAYEVDVDRQ